MIRFMMKMRHHYILRKFSTVLGIVFLLLSMNSCKRHSKPQGVVHHQTTQTQNLPSVQRSVVFQTQWLHQSQFAGYYVALKKGFYRSRGLDVHIEMGGPERPAAEMLDKGKIDFTSMFLTTALSEWEAGKHIVNLAQLSQKSALLWVANKNSGINKLQDLNGKRVGLWYSDFREPSMILIKQQNLQIQVKPVGWTINMFLKGGVDAMNMMSYNEYDVLINSGIKADDLTVFALADLGVNIPEDGIYCKQEYYQANKQVCDDFATGSLEGWRYALEHEEETLAIVLEYQNQEHLPANIPHQRWMLAKMKELILAKPEQFGILSQQSFQESTRLMQESGFIQTIPEYSRFVSDAHFKKN